MTKHNIEQLKVLNSVVFPVSYNDKFYADALELGQFAKLGMTTITFALLVWEFSLFTAIKQCPTHILCITFYVSTFISGPILLFTTYTYTILHILHIIAWYNDLMVGAVCCRVEKEPSGDKKLYIMTLGCLEAYRNLGIGIIQKMQQ